MGVHLKLAAISETNIEQLLENPRLIWKVIFPTEIHQAAQLSPARIDLLPEQFPIHETLGEYWHALHYLLSGQVWSGIMPEAFLLDGGSFIGSVDVGYGPARIFDIDETKAIAAMLARKQPADLAELFNPLRMWMLIFTRKFGITILKRLITAFTISKNCNILCVMQQKMNVVWWCI